MELEREKKGKRNSKFVQTQKENEAEKLTDGKPKTVGGYKTSIKESTIPLISFWTEVLTLFEVSSSEH
jgi:hypothetical protein